MVPAALNAKMRTIEVATFVTTERETADNSSLRGYSITSFQESGRKHVLLFEAQIVKVNTVTQL